MQGNSPAEKALRSYAMSLPGVREDFPWGHSAFKVKEKAFLFMGYDGGGFSLSVKLPESRHMALTLPFAEPTGYGLGKSGWVSAKFASGEAVPIPLLTQWVAESYRAIAPRKLLAELDGAPPAAAKKKAAAKKAPARKPARG